MLFTPQKGERKCEDILILVIGINKYFHLPRNLSIVSLGANKREILLKGAYDALGALRVSVLPGLHALSGADITRSFKRRGKTFFRKKILEADDATLNALASLDKKNIQQKSLESIERLIFQVYQAQQNIRNLSDLRCGFSQKKSAVGNMSPTRGSFNPSKGTFSNNSVETMWYASSKFTGGK